MSGPALPRPRCAGSSGWRPADAASFGRARFISVSARQPTAILHWGLVALVAFFWLMVPVGFFSYASFGLGRDRPAEGMVIHQYFRLRWPGNGSFLVGGGAEYIRVPGEDVDRIDFAFRMFEPPVRRTPTSRWNRLGFWRFRVDEAKQVDVRTVSVWWGVPSILPALALTPSLWWLRR